MTQEEKRQAYYEYKPDTSKWWMKDPPPAEPWFQDELNKLAGFSDNGKPKLRVVWAGDLMHDITEKPTLKYKVVREITTGYIYIKKDGTEAWTKSMNIAEDAKVPWEFHAVIERIELGRLRWVIERHVPAHVLRELGRFQNLRDANGVKILRDLPPEGVYDHFFWIQRANNKYRDLDRQVLTAIKAMWLYEVNTSQAQKALDDFEEEQRSNLINARECREIYEAVL